MPLCRDPESLRPITKNLLFIGISLYLGKYKKKVFINETLRSDEVQKAYYARTREPYKVVKELYKKAGLYDIDEKEASTWATNTPAGGSAHNFGVAFDLVPTKDGKPNWNASVSDWNEIGECFKLAEVKDAKGNIYSMSWGGDWKGKKDNPHFEVKRTNKDGSVDSWKKIVGA